MSLYVVSLPHVSAACRTEPQNLVSPGLHNHRAALQAWKFVKATSGCQTPHSAGWRGSRGAAQADFSSKRGKVNGVCCFVPITGLKEISRWFFPIKGSFYHSSCLSYQNDLLSSSLKLSFIYCTSARDEGRCNEPVQFWLYQPQLDSNQCRVEYMNDQRCVHKSL